MKDKSNKQFWQRVARLYTPLQEKSNLSLYNELCRLIEPELLGKTKNLEFACGTGQLTFRIVKEDMLWFAIDYAEKMIAEAKKRGTQNNILYEVQDATKLTYRDSFFDCVIIANALHIMPEPEKALAEIKRVLKPDGILLAPTFTHKNMGIRAKAKSRLLRLFGFPLYHSWSPESYCDFLQENGWKIEKQVVIEASFPMTYVKCRKRVT